MTRKTMVLVGMAIVLAGVYAVFFTDWFASSTIQIIYQIRPAQQRGGFFRGMRGNRPADSQTHPVAFSLDGKYPLTLVKVVPADEYATNKYVTPLWHLVTASNSAPKNAIIYGWPLPGMKPAIPGLRPEPLEANKKYLLLVEAGRAKGQIVFRTKAVAKPTP